jgi:pyruvate/2-oxoglutarate dehydrogenase complex dihydrolipoamide acyltransferase (E2) component
MEEGVLLRWRVREGDRIKRGDILAEVETDKAIMEIEAFVEGVVKKICKR